MMKQIGLYGLVIGLAACAGCAEDGQTRDTGIGAESGRLIGSEVGGRGSWLGGHIGSTVGRETEKGVAKTSTSQQKSMTVRED